MEDARAADWRFLLPAPRGDTYDHMVVLGGSPALRRWLVENGIARRVTDELTPDVRADAIVALAPARARVADVARSLVPGGAAYLEVDFRRRWPLALGARWLSRALAAHGLSGSAVYWLAGGLPRPSAYVPVAVREALAWYLATSAVATTPVRAALEVGLRALRIVRRPELAPLGKAYGAVVVAVAGGGRPPAPALLAASVAVERQRAASPLPLVLTAGQAFNRVVVLPFARGVAEPLTVLKLGRVGELNENTEHEQRVLEHIQATGPSAPVAAPRPLGTYRWRSLTVAAETCAPGRPLSSWSERWGTRQQIRVASLDLATDWLAGFQRVTELSREPWAESHAREWVQRPINAFRATFGPSADEERLFELTHQRSDELSGVPFPIVWNHWGFDDRNIFRRGDDITVIDWESSSPGPPLWDLMYYLARWIARARSARTVADSVAAFVSAFGGADERDPVVSAVVAARRRYLRVLDLDARFEPLLLVALCAQRAVDRAERAPAAAAAGGRDWGNIYRAYVAALAALERDDR